MNFIRTRIPITLIAATCGIVGIAALSAGAAGKDIQPTAQPQTGKSGAQLWAETCNRCHNVRAPQSYSRAQWDVAMLHMRVRANLTGEEAKKILEFLRSAS